jgi:hypothetical protein
MTKIKILVFIYSIMKLKKSLEFLKGCAGSPTLFPSLGLMRGLIWDIHPSTPKVPALGPRVDARGCTLSLYFRPGLDPGLSRNPSLNTEDVEKWTSV